MSNVIFDNLFTSLEKLIIYFSKNRNDASAEVILQNLIKIKDNANQIRIVADDIASNAHKYDIVPGLQANGYRSLLSILESLLLTTIQLLNIIWSKCENTFFRGNEYAHKLRSCSDVLHQLRGLYYYAQILMNSTPDGDLFLDENASETLMHDCEILAKACFYGSLHGFQYAGSVMPVVNTLSLFSAQYNDIHQPTGAWATMKSAFNSSRYVVSPDLRGEKLEEVYNGGDIRFFKKLWSFGESGIIQAVPNLVAPSLRVNKPIEIPTEVFTLDSSHYPEEGVSVTFSSTIENKTFVNARLMSNEIHEGQKVDDSSKKVQIMPRSKKLLFFCHGGGFIALTTKSYETLLRDWAKELACPILSIDYSLSPEAPFPQAFEECFYAYCWAMKHAEELGTTAENVVFAGDSAGGNLVLSVALRAGMYGIKMPNSIVTMYPSCVVRYSASPARLMSVMDPLLPLGLLSGCLGAYSAMNADKVKRSASTSDEFNNKPLAPSEQPVSFQFLSNLVKDVGDGFNRMRASKRDVEMTQIANDNDFDHVDVGDANGNKAEDRDGDVKFKLTLPHNFKPLKSKFRGDNFRMRPSGIVKNPFLSPAYASDDLIKTLPHVDIIGCEFDPLLDDAVLFGKRLHNLGKSYQFHVVRGLPHGFLNFQVARETREASKMCLGLIQNGLHLLKR